MRKFLKFIPVQLTICLVLGILFGNSVFVQPVILLLILIVFVVVLGIVYIISNKQYQPLPIFVLVTWVLTFFIGMTTISFHKIVNQKRYYGNQILFKEEVSQTAIISIRKVLKPSISFLKYEANVIEINGKKSKGKVLVNIHKNNLNEIVSVDNLLLIETTFNQIPEAKNPFGFSYKNYLKNQQIYHQIFLDSTNFLKLGISSSTIFGKAAKLRENINNKLVENGFKNNELAVINALLLGQRQEISTDLLESYTGAGAIHILAVSGLHIGILLLILNFIFSPLLYFKKGKIIASFCIITALWFYAIVAGLSPSVVRAVSMFTAISIGMYLNRPSNTYNTLIISMFFLLLFNPFYVFEVGFQLSYLAVFSIVWIQPKLYNLWKPSYWTTDKLWQLFTLSIAAQLGVLPLSLYYFHQFPGLFFVTNLVIIPLLGFILFGGILIILLAGINALPGFLALFYMHIIRLLNNFVDFIAKQEFFIFENIHFTLLFLVGFYVIIFTFFKWTEKKTYVRLILVFISILVLQLGILLEKYQLQKTNKFFVFQKQQETVLAQQIAENLTVNSDLILNKNSYPISDFIVGSGVKNVKFENSIQNYYSFKNKRIIVVDSLQLYKFKTIKSPIIIIRQSPKVNLDRLLKELDPQLVIADGSNYSSYILRWQESCKKNKTPFYNTVENGAFVIN